MKKILLALLALSLTVVSCKEDEKTDDAIIGTWKNTKDVISGEEEVYSPYYSLDTYYSDGKLESSVHPNYQEEAGFEKINGTWKKLSDSKYEVEVTLPGVGSLKSEAKIEFLNNTMIITDSDGDKFYYQK